MRKTESELRDTFSRMLEEFDFEKVEEGMMLLGWKWSGGSHSPTKKEMIEMCWVLFNRSVNDCIVHKTKSTTSSGGFEVEITKKGYITLRFVLADLSDYELADYENIDEEAS